MRDSECIQPGALTTADVVAYAEGEASERVVDHLRRCPACAREAKSYAQTNRSLHQALYRVDCPSPQTLGEYNLQLLSTDEQRAVAAHARDCPRCADELRTLREFLRGELFDESMVRPGLGQQLRRLVATLVPPSTRPAAAGLRGTTDQSVRTYQAGNLSITIEWRPGPRPGTAALVGLVLSEDDVDLSGHEVRLGAVQETGARATALAQMADDLGNFLFDELRPGRYQLEIDLADAVVVLDDLHWTG